MPGVRLGYALCENAALRKRMRAMLQPWNVSVTAQEAGVAALVDCEAYLKRTREYIKKELGAEYRFNKDTLVMAKDYGVPQLRERNIFLLVKKDLNYIWEFPEKQKEITLEEAIGNLPSLDPLLRD